MKKISKPKRGMIVGDPNKAPVSRSSLSPRKRTYRRSAQTRKETGYRSGLEVAMAEDLTSQGVDYAYEPKPLVYLKPARKARYTPDFVLKKQGIIIEAKGRFDTADRQKHLLVKDQFPDLDIRFVFSNPNTRISSRSKTTYAMWCEKNGFQYAKSTVPAAWLTEKPTKKRLKAMEVYLNGES